MEIDRSKLKDNLLLFVIGIPIIAILLLVDNGKLAYNNLSNNEINDKKISIGDLVINEIMSSNKGVYTNSSGKVYDWIELYNGSNYDINLKNYGLSDSKDEKVKWLFPDVTIKSKEYLVIFLTEMENEDLYATFSLKSAGGENVTLRSSSGDILDSVKTVNIPKNNTMARDSDGKWTITDKITPGFSNNDEGREEYINSLYNEEDKLIINEVLPNNKGNFILNNNLPGYIEIINNSNENINLKDYFISNDINKPFLYKLPNETLKPNEIYLIYTDGLGKDNHTSFELNNKIGQVYLSKNNKIVSKCEYENLSNGLALIYKDGEYIETSDITPGYSNDTEGKKSYEKSLSLPKELIISEVMNSNNKYLPQNGGKYYDWIELYNNTGKTINLNEYSIAKDKNDGGIYILPDIKLEKGKYIVIMASGDSKLSNSKYKHIDFKISNNEGIFLFHKNKLVDSIFIYNIPKGYSYGKDKDSIHNYYKKPTPGTTNDKNGVLEISYAPIFSKEPGKYDNVKYIDIELKGNGRIYYTLDGSTPNSSSKLYTGPIRIKETSTIKAITYKEGAIPSDIVTNSYIVNEKHKLPVVSVTINTNSFNRINSNPSADITVDAHVQLIEDGQKFSIDCGMKVFGGDSRFLAKKSYALKFGKEYGGTLKYKVFDNRDAYEYKTLVLRSGSQDMDGSLFKDELVSSVLDEYGTVDVQANKPVILYINNKYHGIYYIREKIDEEFVANHYNVNSGTTNIVRIDYDVTNGSSKMLRDLNDYVTSHDMSNDKYYKEVEKKLDIENFIDLWIAQMYSGDYDVRNVRFFNNPNIDDGKIKLIGYDFDFAFEHYPDNYIVWMTDYSGMGYYKINNKLMVNLLKNKKFKEKFLERLGYNLKNVWTYEHVNNYFEKYYNLIEPEVRRDHERWGFTYQSWNLKCIQISNFIKDREAIIKKQVKAYFELSDKQFKKYFK